MLVDGQVGLEVYALYSICTLYGHCYGVANFQERDTGTVLLGLCIMFVELSCLFHC